LSSLLLPGTSVFSEQFSSPFTAGTGVLSEETLSRFLLEPAFIAFYCWNRRPFRRNFITFPAGTGFHRLSLLEPASFQNSFYYLSMLEPASFLEFLLRFTFLNFSLSGNITCRRVFIILHPLQPSLFQENIRCCKHVVIGGNWKLDFRN
jgi:hypothetical protein